jgi:hypothetical protein
MKEETNISAGTPPTNSIGTGSPVSLPPAHEPPGRLGGSKVVRRKRKKICESQTVYAFKVTIADLGDIIVYAKNETQVKTKLREYIRNSGGIINIERVFATDVINFYTQKRTKAMKRSPDVVLENMEQTDAATEVDPQAAKAEQSKKVQGAKQDAQKRIQLAKQNAQKTLQAKKSEMQKNLATQQTNLKMKAKSGALNDQSAV